MGDRKRRLSRAIDALALRVEHGALLAATDPAALLESAGDRIAALESRLADVERERDAAVARLREIEAGAPAVRELRDAAVALADMVEEAARDDVPGILGRRALRAEERLAALTQAAGEAAETLDALIYWHDCGDIDRSWWEDARDRVAALRAALDEGSP